MKIGSVTEQVSQDMQNMPGPRNVHAPDYWTETEQVAVIGQVETDHALSLT